jgi:hypothetical protein
VFCFVFSRFQKTVFSLKFYIFWLYFTFCPCDVWKGGQSSPTRHFCPCDVWKGGSPSLRDLATYLFWYLHFVRLCISIHSNVFKEKSRVCLFANSLFMHHALRHILKNFYFTQKKNFRKCRTPRALFELYTESTSLTRGISVAARLVLLRHSRRARDDPNSHWFNLVSNMH